MDKTAHTEDTRSKEIVSRRTLITATSKTMFLWVAGASVIVVAALVILFYMFKQFSFNNEVVSAKWKAADTLKKNVSSFQVLKKNIDNLTADDALASVRSQNGDNLQVVVDALPVSGDSTLFAASLQNIIAPRSGVSLETVTIPTPATVTSADGTTTDQANSSQPIEMVYQIQAVGTYQSIQNFLANLEKTIRPVHVTSIELRGSDAILWASITLKTYYQPVKDINITKKVIHYDEKS